MIYCGLSTTPNSSFDAKRSVGRKMQFLYPCSILYGHQLTTCTFHVSISLEALPLQKHVLWEPNHCKACLHLQLHLVCDILIELRSATVFCVYTGHLNNNASNRLTKPFDKPRTRTQDGIPGSSFNGCDICFACTSSCLFFRGVLFISILFV